MVPEPDDQEEPIEPNELSTPDYEQALANLSNAELKLVQELLGHATIAMTLDNYSHYLPSMGDQASGAMGDALG